MIASVSACDFYHEKQSLRRAELTSNFSSLSENLFLPRCANCHSGSHAPHGIDLSSYQKIVNSSVFPPLVIPGNPEQSSLYQACASGKMPQNAPPLTSAELKAVYDWIKNGANEADSSPSPGPSMSPKPTPTGEPHDPSSKEPCDSIRIGNEPGYLQCTNEPGDDD